MSDLRNDFGEDASRLLDDDETNSPGGLGSDAFLAGEVKLGHCRPAGFSASRDFAQREARTRHKFQALR
jgi:hypothetical protein